MSFLSGFLLASPDGNRIPSRIREDYSVKHVFPFITWHSESFLGLKQWERCTLYSEVLLLDEPTQDQAGGSFAYPLVLARSATKILVLAERKKIAEYAVNAIFQKETFPSLRRVNFYVDRIIEGIDHPGSQYVATSIHGRVAGNDRSLRTISMYGENVTESIIFRHHQSLFNFFSCGFGFRKLRMGNLNQDDRELLRLGNDGFISMVVAERVKAREIIKALNYIIQNRWVGDWVAEPGL